MRLCNGLQSAFFFELSEHARTAETKKEKNWFSAKGASATDSEATGRSADIRWTGRVRYSVATHSAESTGCDLSFAGDDVAFGIGYSKLNPDDGGQIV